MRLRWPRTPSDWNKSPVACMLALSTSERTRVEVNPEIEAIGSPFLEICIEATCRIGSLEDLLDAPSTLGLSISVLLLDVRSVLRLGRARSMGPVQDDGVGDVDEVV